VESFDEAVAKLERLLSEHDRPARLVWVQPEDVVELWTRTFVRVPREVSDKRARVQFEQARSAGHAIALDVLAHSCEGSFVVVDVAADRRDAELHMMSSEHVKLSIPESSLPLAREVLTGTTWAVLRLMAAS
jgi:hypothetical protein